MEASDSKRFGEAMGLLKASYPHFKPTDDDWRKTLGRYFEKLKDQPFQAIGAACMRASQPEYYPDWFPNEGQLKRVVIDCAKDRRREEQQHADHGGRLLPLEYYADVPDNAGELAQWIASGANKFEQLGRRWKAESKQLWLDPNRPTPRELHEKRMREFWETWGSDAQQQPEEGR